MDKGFTDDLLYVAMVALVVCLLLLSSYMPRRQALFVGILKISIPFLYFGLYGPHYTAGDDLTYMREGSNLMAMTVSPLDVVTTRAGFEAMTFQVGTFSFLFPLVNLIALNLFGNHYYAPVFVNVVATCACGYFAKRITTNFGVEKVYANWFTVFFLLHWDLLTWSSIMNLKDVWCLLITLMFFDGFQLVFQLNTAIRTKIASSFLMLLAIMLSAFVRPYLPFLLLLSVGIWSVIFDRGTRRYISAFLTVLALGLYTKVPLGIATQATLSPFRIVLGSLHYFTTPQPWDVRPEYAFLEASSLLHWIFFIPTIWGMVSVFRKYDKARVFIVFVILVVFYYGVYDEVGLGGPRHRLPMLEGLALFQFEFIWSFLSPGLRILKSQAAPYLNRSQGIVSA